jgi:TetR/AcrR family transcriptional regulator, cholesterol catabolism regulator
MSAIQMKSRSEQKAATRDRVLEAARRLFVQFGYESVTIKQIADEAGVAAGSVFTTFESKADLLAYITHEDYARVVTLSKSVLEAHADRPVEEQLLQFFRVSYATNLPQLDILRWSVANGWTGTEAVSEHTMGTIRLAQRVLRDVLQRGVERGEINPETDLTELAQMLHGLYLNNYGAAIFGAVDLEGLCKRVAKQIGILMNGVRPIRGVSSHPAND